MPTSLSGPSARKLVVSRGATALPSSPGRAKLAASRPHAGLAVPRAEQILARVRATPPGFVRTYGDVSPGAPRLAGAVLHACEDPQIPWHRIVRADGSLAKGEPQRRRLEAEGVPFRGSRVEMRVARMPVVEDLPAPPSLSRGNEAWSGR